MHLPPGTDTWWEIALYILGALPKFAMPIPDPLDRAVWAPEARLMYPLADTHSHPTRRS